MKFKKNQLVWLEVDIALGPAQIIDDTDTLKLHFLESGEERHYTKKNPPLKRLNLSVGQKVYFKQLSHEEAVILEKVDIKNDLYELTTNHGVFQEADISKLSLDLGVLDLLRQSKFSTAKSFFIRQEALELKKLRESHVLRGALGCRVQLLPHQLLVLDRSLNMLESSGSIRILLADEVGLGKTIEAGLVFSALHARQKLKKVLVLVPQALKVQWLTESFRRFNIRFRLDHEELIEESEFRDFVISSLDEIESNMNDLDLLIVDESHRLIHDPHKSKLLEELVSRSQHVMFLSATPQLHGADEFLKMMKILGGKHKPLVFQSKRSELGLKCFRQLEAVYVSSHKTWREEFLSQMLEKKEKVFFIGTSQEDVKKVWNELRQKFGEHFALFHEGMDLVERDRQAAYFADPEGAQFMISSEIGGEGRNFQFCHHMVLLDLPKDPLVVEQRIGRLDRLGQKQNVHVWCPVLEGSEEETVFERLKDEYQVFEKPWSGSGLADGILSGESQDLVSLQETSHAFVKVNFNLQQSQKLLQSSQGFVQQPISEFLEKLYDLFGVEHEDFDTRGNWRVITSSLMFVDYFPGLGESGERVFTFDRDQALAREDMTLMTIDRPDFIESIEFLLNSEWGKLCVAKSESFTQKDILLALLRPQIEFWSVMQSRPIDFDLSTCHPLESLHDKTLPMTLLKSLPQFIEQKSLQENLEALLIVIPNI